MGGDKVTREQKRLAAIFLCLMGILGTIMAMRDRVTSGPEESNVQTETQAEYNGRCIDL